MTAIVCVFFGLTGILVILEMALGVYVVIQENRPAPAFMLPNLIVGITTALLLLIGAWKVWRFERNGLFWIAAVLVLSPVRWIFKDPATGDIVFFFLLMTALAISWFDLEPVGHGR